MLGDLKGYSLVELKERERRLVKRWDDRSDTEKLDSTTPYILTRLNEVRDAIAELEQQQVSANLPTPHRTST